MSRTMRKKHLLAGPAAAGVFPGPGGRGGHGGPAGK
jgi:hypothetical protein